MGHARPRPKHLSAKLLSIRLHLKLSQAELARRLSIKNYNDVWKWENNINEPNLFALHSYSKLCRLPVETLIDDNQDLQFGDLQRGMMEDDNMQDSTHNVLICRHNAPKNAIRLSHAGTVHACPIADTCHCEPLTLSEAEFEAAQRGEWSERVLALLKAKPE